MSIIMMKCKRVRPASGVLYPILPCNPNISLYFDKFGLYLPKSYQMSCRLYPRETASKFSEIMAPSSRPPVSYDDQEFAPSLVSECMHGTCRLRFKRAFDFDTIHIISRCIG